MRQRWPDRSADQEPFKRRSSAAKPKAPSRRQCGALQTVANVLRAVQEFVQEFT
jgi:hypothetical protein